MNNFDKELILIVLMLTGVFYLFYRSLLKFKKLTNYQIYNRWNLINMQGTIFACLLGFSWSYNYILHNYVYQFFVDLFQIQISQSTFVLYSFGIIALAVFVLNFKFNEYVKQKDERVVNIEQEATFAGFKPMPRDVKPIKHYSHYFNGIALERSPKDYTIQSVKLNIDLNDIQKFKIEQEKKAVLINDFYARLIDYLNLKSKTFDYQKIEEHEIQNCKTMLDLKIKIFKRFEKLTQKQYFASISQLFQIANREETEFLSFLRDSQHFKFSTTGLKHAILFLQLGVLK